MLNVPLAFTSYSPGESEVTPIKLSVHGTNPSPPVILLNSYIDTRPGVYSPPSLTERGKNPRRDIWEIGAAAQTPGFPTML